jgi:putative peptidoglycan lipid II flippase
MNLRNALLSVSGLTLLSRLAGFGRDWLIALYFGAGANTDAFFVAFRFPNLLRRLFAEGAFSQAFVPMLITEKNRDRKNYHQFISQTASLLLILLMLVAIIGVLFAPTLVRITAPGFVEQPEKFALTVFLTRWCFPYIVLVSLLALISSVLQCEKKFTAPALAPVFLNLSFIVAVLFTLDWWENPVHALGYAALAGGVLQLFVPLFAVHRLGLMPRWNRYFLDNPAVINLLKNMVPATLGVASGQINLLLNTVFASFLVSGSVSWLYYADRIMELPVGLLGAALAVIILPSLSQAVIDQSRERLQLLVDWGLRLALIITLPASLAFFWCAPMIFLTLFHYGAFTAESALQSGSALSVYGIGLFPLIAQKVLAPVFYAQKNLRTPALIGLGALVVNQLQNLLWVRWLQWGHVGLALSISLTAVLQCALLYALLWQQRAVLPNRALLIFIGKLLVALFALAIVIVAVNPAWSWWLAASVGERAVRLSWLVGGSVLVYAGAWWCLGLRPRDFSMRD